MYLSEYYPIANKCIQNINERETVVSSNQEVGLFETLHKPVNKLFIFWSPVTVTGIKKINNLLNDIHPRKFQLDDLPLLKLTSPFGWCTEYGEEDGEEDGVVKIW